MDNHHFRVPGSFFPGGPQPVINGIIFRIKLMYQVILCDLLIPCVGGHLTFEKVT